MSSVVGSKGFSEWGSREWANEQLKFAIKVLKGECGGSVWKNNVALALYIRDRLWSMGWRWQADRVDNWVHRLDPKRRDPKRRGRR